MAKMQIPIESISPLHRIKEEYFKDVNPRLREDMEWLVKQDKETPYSYGDLCYEYSILMQLYGKEELKFYVTQLYKALWAVLKYKATQIGWLKTIWLFIKA